MSLSWNRSVCDQFVEIIAIKMWNVTNRLEKEPDSNDMQNKVNKDMKFFHAWVTTITKKKSQDVSI